MWLIGFWLTLNVNITFDFIKLQEICEKIYGLFLTIIYMRVTWCNLSDGAIERESETLL